MLPLLALTPCTLTGAVLSILIVTSPSAGFAADGAAQELDDTSRVLKRAA